MVLALGVGVYGCGGSDAGNSTTDVPGGWRDVDGQAETETRVRQVMLTNATTQAKFAVQISAYNLKKPPACKTLAVGPCRVETCKEAKVAAATKFDYSSMGDVTITLGSTSMVIKPSDGYGKGGPAPLWAAPGPIQIAATGAETPAFSGTVVGPAAITLTAPTLPPEGGLYDESEKLSVPRAKPLAFTWSGGGPADEVRAFLWWAHVSDDFEYDTTAECRFPASPGGGTVPSEVLALFPKNVPDTVGWLIVDVANQVEIDPGDGGIVRLFAQEHGRRPDSGFVHVAVSFE